MPPLAPVPNVLRINILWSKTGVADKMINSVHWQQSVGEVSEEALSTWLTSFWTNFSAQHAMWDSDTTLIGLEGIDLSSDTGAVANYTNTQVGTATGGLLTAGTCVVLQQKIARRYRGGHPRLYLPWGTDGALADPNSWDPVFASALLNGWNEFITAQKATTTLGATFPVSVSYFKGETAYETSGGKTKYKPTPRTGGPVVDPIFTYAVNLQVGSQRRRNDQGA